MSRPYVTRGPGTTPNKPHTTPISPIQPPIEPHTTPMRRTPDIGPSAPRCLPMTPRRCGGGRYNPNKQDSRASGRCCNEGAPRSLPDGSPQMPRTAPDNPNKEGLPDIGPTLRRGAPRCLPDGSPLVPRGADTTQQDSRACGRCCCRRRLKTEPVEDRFTPALTCGFSGADDGIRTRDPHLGKVLGQVA